MKEPEVVINEEAMRVLIDRIEFLVWKVERLTAEVEAMKDKFQWYLSDK
jgi:hypothetical protein